MQYDMDSIELIENISTHEIYGIVSEYNQICIRDVWYAHDKERDRLVRLTSLSIKQEDLFNELVR